MLVPNIFTATAVLCTLVTGLPIEAHNKATTQDFQQPKLVDDAVILYPINNNKARIQSLARATEADNVAVPLSQKKHNKPVIQTTDIRWEADEVAAPVSKRAPLLTPPHPMPPKGKGWGGWGGLGIGKPPPPVPASTVKFFNEPQPKFLWPWDPKPKSKWGK